MIAEAEPHIRAVMDLLNAQLTFPAGLGIAPDYPPAAAVYPDMGGVEAARLVGDRSAVTIYIMVHAIGEGPEQALWVGDKLRTALLGEPPTVEGRRVYRLTQTMGASPLQRDDQVQPPLYVSASEYRLFSQPG